MNESRLKILIAILMVVVVALLLERFGFYTVFPDVEPDSICIDGEQRPEPRDLPHVPLGTLGLASTGSTLPDSPIGRAASWGMDAINLQRSDLTVAELQERFAPAALERASAETLHGSFVELSGHGPYVLAGLKATTTETRIEGVVLGPKNRVFDFVAAVEEAEPHRLTGFLLTPRLPTP